MKPQNFELENARIREQFQELKKNSPEKLKRRLDLSWSNWGFGMESLSESATRLKDAGLDYIELHGNHYAPDLGYEPDETATVLSDHGLRVSGVCGMFSTDNCLSSNRAIKRQAALDYIRRELEFMSRVGGHYLLVVPGAVGRTDPFDDTEFYRSAETLRMVAQHFVDYGVRAAVEPIRASEVSMVHTFDEAEKYIREVDHPGVQHINGDAYHMLQEERHLGAAIVKHAERLTNLHMADSNRRALGEGCLDLDTIIMALYVGGYNQEGKFVTAEPLGPGGDPYPALYGKPDTARLDHLVKQTVSYFREREEELLKEAES
jgi:sugar phosphate isomerase/epimerase